MEGFLLPRRYFVTSGVSQGAASELNAFDMALRQAGISDCNLVGVSSIIPSEASRIEPVTNPPGAITFCVLAEMTGTRGERVGAGLAWAMGTARGGERFGMVAEHTGPELPSGIEALARADLMGMAEAREMVLEEVRTEVVSTLCRDGFGSAVAALVYVL